MNTPIRPGRYRHFKGNEYQVIDTALDSETEQPYVIYRPLYGKAQLWIRPLDQFCEIVDRNGLKQPRFNYVGEM